MCIRDSFYFLGFLLCSYANVPVLGVALIAIIIGIDKFDLLGLSLIHI